MLMLSSTPLMRMMSGLRARMAGRDGLRRDRGAGARRRWRRTPRIRGSFWPARGNSLVYRSADGGAKWTRLAFPRHFLGTVTSLVFDTAQPGRYLVGIDANGSPFSGLWTSEDEGRTWKATPELAGAPVHAIAAWPKDPRVLAAGTAQGVWVSDDSGRKWRRISKPWLHEMRVITAVEFASNDRGTIYAGTPHLPWKTSDGGETWQSIHEG